MAMLGSYREDATNKLWEEVAAAYGRTSCKYFQVNGMLESENQPLKYAYTTTP